MTGFATKTLHVDNGLSKYADVAPSISVSNNFEYPANREELANFLANEDIYSRCSQPNVTRCEAVLSSILDGHAVAYANGVSAFHAVIMAVNPKRVFVDHAYYGLLALLAKLQSNGYLEVLPLEEIENKLQKGDLVHIESPMSPWGTAINVKSFTSRAHAKGGIVCLDATIGPPPLFAPFSFGVDIIVHSGSKYMGGHSDVLAGVVATQNSDLKKKLIVEREDFGTILPTFQAWLLLRSLRTFSLRVKQQSKNATQLAQFLETNKPNFTKLAKVYHTSLQKEEFVIEQHPNGGPATFSIETTDEETARELPNRLKLFIHATSMGGVESSIEWRALSDANISRCLLRFSVGVEDIEDLLADVSQALLSFQ